MLLAIIHADTITQQTERLLAVIHNLTAAAWTKTVDTQRQYLSYAFAAWTHLADATADGAPLPRWPVGHGPNYLPDNPSTSFLLGALHEALEIELRPRFIALLADLGEHIANLDPTHGQDMDPNVAFSNLIVALLDGDYDEAIEAADALTEWHNKGGFLPFAQEALLTSTTLTEALESIDEDVDPTAAFTAGQLYGAVEAQHRDAYGSALQWANRLLAQWELEDSDDDED